MLLAVLCVSCLCLACFLLCSAYRACVLHASCCVVRIVLVSCMQDTSTIRTTQQEACKTQARYAEHSKKHARHKHDTHNTARSMQDTSTIRRTKQEACKTQA